MTAVEFDGVCLRYGAHVTLADGTFSIGQGAFVGLLGSNGAGKTTLLRAILGLIRPASGSIRVFGRPATRGNAQIGYVPQFRQHMGDVRLTGRDLLTGSLTGSRFGWPFSTPTERQDVDHALEVAGAAELAEHPIGTLSGGERQRVLIAQALLGQPKMLLLDEPLVSLDPYHQESLVNLIQAIRLELGIAVVFCSHELTPLLGRIDQVLFLGQGKAAIGPVDEVITTPVMSDLYGAPMDVLRAEGRVFVVAAATESGA